ncbi:MAG: hypothetical protein ACKPKO_60500, partial [Candidatus Fonsibacter sp.]
PKQVQVTISWRAGQRSKEPSKYASLERRTYQWRWFRKRSTYFIGHERDSYAWNEKTFKLVVGIGPARKSICITH